MLTRSVVKFFLILGVVLLVVLLLLLILLLSFTLDLSTYLESEDFIALSKPLVLAKAEPEHHKENWSRQW